MWAVNIQVATIGADLPKHVFQVHGVDANDNVIFNKPPRHHKCCRSSANSRRVSSAWKRVPSSRAMQDP
jgi:hypothetical protein